MLDLSFLAQLVQLPLWFVLVLAGYQKAVAMMRARSGGTRKESSGSSSTTSRDRKVSSGDVQEER